ncbi:MAG: DUF413 domain-containing protein [Spongiibacteraceae bacterium]
MTIEGFQSLGIYYDDVNFPKGFSKSGEFTISESDLLHKYGSSLMALEKGTATASTDEELQFVAVCQGQREAESKLERLWLKYRSKCGSKKWINAFGSAKPDLSGEIDDYIEDDIIDDDEE